MQNKTDFVRTAALQLYAASDWQGTAVQAVSCAERPYDALCQKGYGFAETAQPVTALAQSKHHRGDPDG